MQIDKAFLYGHSLEALEVVGATEQRSGPPAFAKLKLVAGSDDAEE